MKTKVFLLMVLACLSFATSVQSQTLITSTTASTTVVKPESSKSGRVKGLVIRPELGVGIGFSFECPDVQLTGTVAYQFNPYIAVGGGVGYEWLDLPCISSVFANFRAYLSDTYVSPYIDLKLGRLNGGFMGGASLGLQCKRFDYGISVKYGDYRYDDWVFAMNFAYNIQFGKKK